MSELKRIVDVIGDAFTEKFYNNVDEYRVQVQSMETIANPKFPKTRGRCPDFEYTLTLDLLMRFNVVITDFL